MATGASLDADRGVGRNAERSVERDGLVAPMSRLENAKMGQK